MRTSTGCCRPNLLIKITQAYVSFLHKQKPHGEISICTLAGLTDRDQDGYDMMSRANSFGDLDDFAPESCPAYGAEAIDQLA